VQDSKARPAIFLTGAHHARELITVQMTLYSALKLIHQALVANDEKYQNLLMQNVFYIVPIVNPDGVALIERDFLKTFHLLNKRKNMSPAAMKDA
jgi:murein tripeptide amidase MpaA